MVLIWLETEVSGKGNCDLTVLPCPAFRGVPCVLAARQATSAAAGRSAGWCPGSSSLLVPLKSVASEEVLCSFTLLACAGVAASPDPSAMMIQFVQLQGDHCVSW